MGDESTQNPTHIVDHHLVTCLQCYLLLGGSSLAREREVIHHRIFRSRCAQCQTGREAPVGLHGKR